MGMEFKQTGRTFNYYFCPHCFHEMSLDYGFDGEDEYPYYFCDIPTCRKFNYDEDEGDTPIQRTFMVDDRWNKLQGPTQDEHFFE